MLDHLTLPDGDIAFCNSGLARALMYTVEVS